MSDENALFWNHDLRITIDRQLKALNEQIENLPLSQLGSASLDQVCTHLIEKFSIEPLRLFEDQLELVDPEEKTVERYSHEWGETFSQKVLEFRFEIPFEGDPGLFRCCPSQRFLAPPHADVQTSPNLLVFIFQSEDRNGDKIRSTLEHELKLVRSFIQFQANDLSAWNANLPQTVRQGLEARREKLLADQKLVAGLNFKIRRRGDLPATLAFPVTRKALTPMPTPKPGSATAATPMLEMADYDNILGNLAGMSIAIERSPSTFSDIGEEALRDWFIVALNGNFRGDATGETFNREGKTDISIRANGGVIFIAECKFWGGEKVLLETIEQLLGYLTWRDSKAAILIFSRNADFTAVLRQIPVVVRKHPHCHGEVSPFGESGFRFYLRNKTDPDRNHLMTLLAFNVPRTG